MPEIINQAKKTETTGTTVNSEKAPATGSAGGGEEKVYRAGGIGQMLRRFSSDGMLDAASAEYIGKIREVVEDPAHQLDISVRKLRSNIFGFSSGGFTIVVVIEAGISKTCQDIINDDMAEILSAFKEMYPADQKLLNVVTVDQYSLDRYPQMASYITRTLTAQLDPATLFTINDLKKEEQVIINTDPIAVKRFVDKHSCKSTTAVEFGFVASLVNKRQMNQHYIKGDEFFGVGGYVEFIRENTLPGSPVKFVPVIHITEIISVIPIAEIMSMAIPIAAEVFIGAGLWKQPFVNLTKKGENIGNLITDDKGKPWVAKTEKDIADFFAMYIANPVLVLDIVTGHARLPGIGKFASEKYHPDIVKSFARFLDVPEQSLINPARTIFREIVGVAEVSRDIDPTGVIDTRKLTYLFATNKIGNTPGVDKLILRYPAAESRIELLQEELNLSCVPTSMNFCTMLNGGFVQACSAAIQGLGISMPNIGNVQTIPIQGLGAQTYATGNMFAASPVIGGYRHNIF